MLASFVLTMFGFLQNIYLSNTVEDLNSSTMLNTAKSSIVRWSNLKNGRPRSPSLEMNLFSAAMQPVSFWTFLMLTSGPICVMEFSFSGLASMPLLLMMKLSSFLDGTPKTRFVGFSFQRNLLKLSKVSSKSLMKSSGFLVLTTTLSTQDSMFRWS